MKTLRNRINKFFRMYDLSTLETRKMTADDMDDRDALMTAYEAIWLTLEEYDGSEPEHEWLTDLYGDLGDYIDYGYDRKHVKAVDNGKRACFVIGCVAAICFATCLPNDFGFITIGGLLVSLALAVVSAYK